MEKPYLVCETSTAVPDIVLCDDQVSVNAHKELFNFTDDKYILCEFSPVKCVNSISIKAIRIHLCFSWKGILKVALWKDSIHIGDTLYLLRHAGLEDEQLKPFEEAEIDDVFPSLYYGKNFDALRKICKRAKKSAESASYHLGYRFDCHLVAGDSKRIIASSL